MSRPDYEEVRKAAEKRVKKRTEFYQHFIAYIVSSAFFVGAFRDQWWIVFPIVGWGLLVILHSLEIFMNDPLRHERAIQREMEKLGYTATAVEAEKPKRDRVALAEDGELIYDERNGTYAEEEAPRRRQQRS
jgi:hypothetical protein